MFNRDGISSQFFFFINPFKEIQQSNCKTSVILKSTLSVKYYYCHTKEQKNT